jgi:hypothetical protein
LSRDEVPSYWRPGASLESPRGLARTGQKEPGRRSAPELPHCTPICCQGARSTADVEEMVGASSTSSPWALILCGLALFVAGAALCKYSNRVARFWGSIFGQEREERIGGAQRHLLGGIFVATMGALCLLGGVIRLF